MVHVRLLSFSLVAALAGCDMTTCGNRMLTSVDAPDGRHTAAVFRRDCGATTGFSTQVSLVAPGEMPAGSGNVFIAEGEGRVVSVQWLGADRLLIAYRAGSPPVRRESERDGIRIGYRELGGRQLVHCHRNPEADAAGGAGGGDADGAAEAGSGGLGHGRSVIGLKAPR